MLLCPPHFGGRRGAFIDLLIKDTHVSGGRVHATHVGRRPGFYVILEMRRSSEGDANPSIIFPIVNQDSPNHTLAEDLASVDQDLPWGLSIGNLE